jgi:hypothetical protein
MSPIVEPPRRQGGFNLDDYVTVAERVAAFYEKYPDGSLQAELVELTDSRVVVRGLAYRTADDAKPGVAHSSLGIPGTTPYTRGSEVENAETSAVGRAIAFLGFGVKKSIATRDEIQNKQDDGAGTRKPADARKDETNGGGLIGTAVAQGTQDFEIRQGPDGPVLPFRVKDKGRSQIVVAHGALATSLRAFRDEILDQRVTVWGSMQPQSFPKGDKRIEYEVLQLERIVSPAGTFTATFEPDADEPPPVAPGQEPLGLDAEDAAAVDAAMDKAGTAA